MNFMLDSRGGMDVTDQIRDAIIDEIVTGRLRAGAKIPTMQEIARSAKVTFRTARRVVERLVREGYVKSYPGIGTVVTSKSHTVWNGRVAFVSFDDDCASYFAVSVADSLRRHFLRERYLFTPVVASRSPRGDCSQLKTLLGQRVDFVVLMYASPHLEKLVAASGVPYAVVLGHSPSRPGAWTLSIDAEFAHAEFVRHCVRAHVRSVTEVRFAGGDCPSLAGSLREAGIRSDVVEIAPCARCGRFEGIERAALERFLSLPQKAFPDVFVFWDDFVAQGALTAFLKRSVSIPQDVRVVAVSNRGLGPVYPDSLTRFEWDGAAVGRQVAEFVSAVLKKGRLPQAPSLSPTYVFGKTFPFS